MTKPYLAVLLFSALLYPIAWYVMYSREVFDLMFGYLPLAAIGTLSTMTAAILGVLSMKMILVQKPSLLLGMATRLGGATIAGVLSPFMILMVMNVIEGSGVSFGLGWWTIHWSPAFAASFGAYWLTNLLVKQVTPW